LKERRSDKDKHHLNCTCFIDRLDKFEENDISFNEKRWISLIELVTVPENGGKALTIHLKSGKELTILIDTNQYFLEVYRQTGIYRENANPIIGPANIAIYIRDIQGW